MSRDTLDGAIDELVSLLRDSDSEPLIDGVNAVYDYLPPRTVLAGATSVCVYETNIGAETWFIAVTIFKNVASDPRAAQKEMRLLYAAIDAATFVDPGFGPSEWSVTYATSDPPTIEATNVYQVGRQDI